MALNLEGIDLDGYGDPPDRPLSNKKQVNLEGIDLDGYGDEPKTERRSWWKLNPKSVATGTGTAIAEGSKQMIMGSDLMAADEQLRKYREGREHDFDAAQLAGSLDPFGQNTHALTTLFAKRPKTTEQQREQKIQGLEQEVEGIINRIKTSQGKVSALTPEDMSVVEEGLRSGLISFASLSPALAMSMATRNPGPMLAYAGLQSKSTSYAEARAEGLDDIEANNYSRIKAAIEVGSELIPGRVLLKAFGKRLEGKRVTKELLAFLLTDMTSEQAAMIGDALVDYHYELDEELKNAKDKSEIADIMLRRSAVTAFASATGSSLNIGASQGVARALGKPLATPNDHENEVSSEYQSERIKEERINQFHEAQMEQVRQEIESGALNDPDLIAERTDPQRLREMAEQLDASGELAKQFPAESFVAQEMARAEAEIAAAEARTKPTAAELLEAGGDLSQARIDGFDDAAVKRIEKYVNEYAERLNIDPTQDADSFSTIVNDAVALETSGMLDVLDEMTPRQQQKMIELLEREIPQSRQRAEREQQAQLKTRQQQEEAAYRAKQRQEQEGYLSRQRQTREANEGYAQQRQKEEATAWQEHQNRKTEPPAMRPISKPAVEPKGEPPSNLVSYRPPNTAMRDALQQAGATTQNEIQIPTAKAPVSQNEAQAPAQNPVVDNVEAGSQPVSLASQNQTPTTTRELQQDALRKSIARDGIRKTARKKMNMALGKIYRSIPKETLDTLGKKLESRLKGKSKKDRVLIVAENYLGDLARYAPNSVQTKQAITATRRWLKQSFPNTEFSDAEIVDLLSNQPRTDTATELPVEQKANPETQPKAEQKAQPETQPKAEQKTEPKAEQKTEPKVEQPAARPVQSQPEPQATKATTPEPPLTEQFSSKSDPKSVEKNRKAAEKLRNKYKLKLTDRQKKLNDLIANRDRTLWERSKAWLQRQVGAGGNLPRSVYKSLIRRNGETSAVKQIVAMHMHGLKSAAKKTYGMHYDKLSEATKKQINDALASGIPDKSLPAPVRMQIYAMRREMSNMSSKLTEVIRTEVKQLIDRLEGGSGSIAQIEARLALLETLEQNMDIYVNRSYRVFHDKNWGVRLAKESPDVIVTANNYLVAQYESMGMTRKDAQSAADAKVKELLTFEKIMGSEPSQFGSSKLGAKNLNILKHREDIVPEIRALMGEYTDIEINFDNTMSKLSQLVFNGEFLNEVRRVGVGEFLFDGGGPRPAWASVQLAAEGSESYSPLNGYYTSPEIAQAFKDQMGTEALDAIMQGWVRFNGAVKYNNTVGSPPTAIKNFTSAMMGMVANGHNPYYMIHAIKTMNSYFTNRGSGAAYVRKLTRMGVLHDTVRAGVMADLLNDSQILPATEKLFHTNIPSKVANVLQKFYEFGDDFWKIVGFESEKSRLMKYRGMSEHDAEVEAADRIRNGYMTYSNVGRFQKKLRRFPVISSFPSFHSEVLRTTVHQIRYITEDAKHSKTMAAQRLVGFALAHSGFVAVALITKSIFDVDDEEEKALLELAPEWVKNGTMIYVDRDENDVPVYWDSSGHDLYGVYRRIWNAWTRNEGDIEKQATQAGWEFLQPFLGEDITTSAIRQLLNNQKDSGAQIWNPQDDPWQQTNDIAKFGFSSLQPGLTKAGIRLGKASAGYYKYKEREYKYRVDDESLAFVGIRLNRTPAEVSLGFRAIGFTFDRIDISKIINTEFRDINEGSAEKTVSAAERAFSKYHKEMEELYKAAEAARVLGLSSQEIEKELEPIGKSNARAVAQGWLPQLKLSDDAIQGAIDRANRNVSDRAYRDELRLRERRLREFFAKQPKLVKSSDKPHTESKE